MKAQDQEAPQFPGPAKVVKVAQTGRVPGAPGAALCVSSHSVHVSQRVTMLQQAGLETCLWSLMTEAPASSWMGWEEGTLWVPLYDTALYLLGLPVVKLPSPGVLGKRDQWPRAASTGVGWGRTAGPTELLSCTPGVEDIRGPHRGPSEGGLGDLKGTVW